MSCGSEYRLGGRTSSLICMSYVGPDTLFFNPRSRVGKPTPAGVVPEGQIVEVSIHAPAWGATTSCALRSPMFQSTLPRGERPSLLHVRSPETGVSIHAPRVGSDHAVRPRSSRTVFQSTLPRGERPSRAACSSAFAGFNPRSRVGSDRGLPPHNPLTIRFQSTLPRGERRSDRMPPAISGFNPRSRVGSDVRQRRSRRQSQQFQSTLPRGERPAALHREPADASFNPRSRVGSDHADLRWRRPTVQVSIHAPAWGATRESTTSLRRRSVSIHAPAWGATGPGSRFRLRIRSFNPRSRVGSDRRHPGDSAPSSSFNPRSRVGSDAPRGRYNVQASTMFQSTLPRGERRSAPSVDRQLARFQSTLPRGERLSAIRPDRSMPCFNPRSRVGSDRVSGHAERGDASFNPRSRVGSDEPVCRTTTC